LTKSGPSVSSAVNGRQQPRVSHLPPFASSTGQEATELCLAAGLSLDPWEQEVLASSLNEREDGKWAAFEVGVVCPRQNGKNEILLARELAGLFLLGERLIIHAAHQFDTSLEAFRRLKEIVENTPDFSRRVKKNGIKNSHGEEGIELANGQRIRFRTRTKGGGRGFTGDCVIFDEAMEFPESAHGAILPTLSARSIFGDPQVWYTGSAVDKWTHDNGVVFARIRERGHAGEDSSLAFFEWSADCDDPQEAESFLDSPEAWAEANPALGIRISQEHIERERRSMDPRTFAVERLGIGAWPSTDGVDAQVISSETWAALADTKSVLQDPVCLAFDVTPDRSAASIAAAGVNGEGIGHLEIVERKRGTGWVVERLQELIEKWEVSAVIADGSGPAASLFAALDQLDIEVTVVNAKEHAQACGTFFDACEDEALRHLDTPELAAAIKGAVKRPLGDAWAWSRKNSTIDISPLVAVTLAHWGFGRIDSGSVYEDRDLVVL
jgi:phage terminase large subunit-like protein